MNWEQEALFEDGDMSEFDSASHTWDGEADFSDGTTDDFDAETDSESDLNAAQAAAHDDNYGIEIDFDNDTAAFGTLDAGAVDQTSGVVVYWFNANDVEVDSGKIMIFPFAKDGANAGNWMAYYTGDDTIQLRYTDDDDAAQVSSASAAIGTGHHEFVFMFKASSGVGADDGYSYMYMDGALLLSQTGVDNDTQDWDKVDFGMKYTNSAAFDGSFYMDTIKIDPTGPCFASKTAAYEGEYGMIVPIMDTTARYVIFTDPSNEKVVTAECMIDPNTLTMATNDRFVVVALTGDTVGGTTQSFAVNLQYDGSSYEIVPQYTDDAGTKIEMTATDISDEYTKIRLVWSASTAAGNDNGFVMFFINDVLTEVAGSINNDQRDVDNIYFGAVASLDSGTHGLLYFDNCRWASEYEPLGATIEFKERDYTVTFEDRTDLEEGGIWNLEGTRFQGEGSNVSPRWTAIFQGKSSITVNNVYVYKDGSTTDGASTYMPSGSHVVSGNRVTLKPLTALVGGEYFNVCMDITADGERDFRFFKVGALKQETGLI